MNKDALREVYIRVYGKVQGVCYRATVHRHAANLGLKGSVQNLSDGSVEIYVQGEEKELLDFLARIKSQVGAASVSQMLVDWREPSHYYSAFEIV